MDREEASSERSMCRAVGREHENIAGKAEWTEARKELEGGIESERERERTIAKKRGMGKGEMPSECETRRDRGVGGGR